LVGQTTAGQKLADVADVSAAKDITKVIAPTAGANKTRFGNMAKDVAPRLASEPGMGAWTRTGLGQKVTARFDEAASALDDAADARLKGRPIPTKPIVYGLLEERAKLTAPAMEGTLPSRETRTRTSSLVDSQGRPITVESQHAMPIGEDVVPGPNSVRVGQIDRAIKEVKALGPVASYDAIKTIRQAYDGPAKAKYSPSLTADYLSKQGEASGAADVTSVLRDKLGQADPATAVANKEFAFWKKTKDVLDATEEVERTRPNLVRQLATRFTGAVIGEGSGGTLGATIGVLLAPVADAVLSAAPTYKVMLARGLDDLSTALKTGDVPKIEAVIRRLRAMAVAAAAGKQKDKIQ
jgi:hypothetical protein